MLTQRPNMRGCGGRRLGDQAPTGSQVEQRRPSWCVSYKTVIAPPRPRTHWWPVILATSIKIGGVAMSSVGTWYGGDLVAKACKAYWVRPAGRCLGCRQHRKGWRKVCSVPP